MNKVVRNLLTLERNERREKIAAQRAEREGVHPPPVTVTEMIEAAAAQKADLAEIKREQNRIAAATRGYPTRVVDIQLDDTKMIEKFGGRLSKGYALPYTMQRAAGMRWMRARSRMVLKPNIITVKYEMRGEKLRPGTWRMTLPEILYGKIITWLLIECGPTNPMNERSAFKKRARPERKHQGLRSNQLARWGKQPERIDNG